MDTTSIVFMSAGIALAVAAAIMVTLTIISNKKKAKAEAAKIEAAKKNHPSAKPRVTVITGPKNAPAEVVPNDINRLRPGLAMVREERRVADEQALKRIEKSNDDLETFTPSKSLDRDLQVRIEEKERRLRRELREEEEAERQRKLDLAHTQTFGQYDSSAFPSNAIIAAMLLNEANNDAANYHDTPSQSNDNSYTPVETSSQSSTNDYSVSTSYDSPGGSTPSYSGSDYGSSSSSSDSSSSYSSDSSSSSSSFGD
jgi:hypothetical protein